MKYIFLILFLLLIQGVFGLYLEDKNNLEGGNAIRIKDVFMEPENLSPGENGIIKFIIENGADLFVDNIRIQLSLPNSIKFYKDVDRIKLSRLESRENKDVSFRVIANPSANEGLYEGYLLIEYRTHFGVESLNIGQDNKDNYTLGIIIKSHPQIFVQLENSEIYKGNKVGDISIKFINNGLGDIKFLTVELDDSNDYEIISSSKQYIGDLDSDDFDSVDFSLKIKNYRSDIKLPIKITYKDSLNNDYKEDMILDMKIRTARELGKKDNTFYLIILIIIIVVGYFLYKRYRKKKHGKIHKLHHIYHNRK